MARNGLKAVDSKEPNDPYDELEQSAKDIWDEIGLLGYAPEKGKAGLWFARKPGAKANEAIGPAESLHALLSVVKEFIANQPVIKEEKIDADKNGNRFLPEVHETVRTVDIPELRQPSLDFHSYLTDLEDAKDKVKNQRKLVTALVEKHRDILPTDPETGYKFFRVVDPHNPTANAVQIDLVPKGEQIECHLVGDAKG